MVTYLFLAFLVIAISLTVRATLHRGHADGASAGPGEVALLVVLALLGLGAGLSGCVHVQPEDPGAPMCRRTYVEASCSDVLVCTSGAGVWFRTREGLDWLTCGYSDGACQERSRDAARAVSCGVARVR